MVSHIKVFEISRRHQRQINHPRPIPPLRATAAIKTGLGLEGLSWEIVGPQRQHPEPIETPRLYMRMQNDFVLAL